MPQYDNRNTVLLFKNKDKKSESHADYTGTWFDENEQEYWANCWVNTSKSGEKFFKVSKGKLKEKQSSGRQAEREPGIDDDLPF